MPTRRELSITIGFALASFLCSALIFWIEPVVGKELLPLVGGAPAVWTVCLLFFQAALLAGYAFAHALTRLRSARVQAAIFVAVAACSMLLLPIEFRSEPLDPSQPTGWLLQQLFLNLFLPFAALAAAAPLLQHWYSRTREATSIDPYFLYAASNTGSLLALISVPVLIEPQMRLHTQNAAWSLLFVIAAAICALTSLAVRANAAARVTHADDENHVTTRRVIGWIILAAVPSSMLMGVTTYVTGDIAPVPLLWIIPLAVYLLTFIVAFGWLRNGVPSWYYGVAMLVAVAWCTLYKLQATGPLRLLVFIHLAVFAVLALGAHARLAASRPAPSQLTRYYLAIAAGGALGGVFNAIVAPGIFNSYMEYPLAVLLAVILNLRARRSRWTLRFVAVLVLVLITPRFDLTHRGFVLHSDRNFYGLVRVTSDATGQYHELRHGGTLHGAIDVRAPGGSAPLMYFWTGSPIADVIRAVQQKRDSVNVAIVGLGVGTLAWYARPTDTWTFYELNPAVIDIARDTSSFTYLSRSKAHRIEIVAGDARLKLKSVTDSSLDLIVLDAFTSDAIPVHLLTVEAIRSYARKLRPGGILVFNVTNRYLDVVPTVAATGRAAGYSAWLREVRVTPAQHEHRIESSRWLVLAHSASDFPPVTTPDVWTAVPGTGAPVWTDDYSNIWTAFKR